jgi:hypothetical protein
MQKVVALYTKEPRPTSKKNAPVEPDNIAEESEARPHADQAEQLSLLSAEDLAALQRPSDSRPPQGDKMVPSEAGRVQRPCRPRGRAVQLKLPGF